MSEEDCAVEGYRSIAVLLADFVAVRWMAEWVGGSGGWLCAGFRMRECRIVQSGESGSIFGKCSVNRSIISESQTVELD